MDLLRCLIIIAVSVCEITGGISPDLRETGDDIRITNLLMESAVKSDASFMTFANISAPSLDVTSIHRIATPIGYWYSFEKWFMKIVQPADLSIDLGLEMYDQLIVNGFAINTLFSFLGRPELLGTVILVSLGIVYVVIMLVGGFIFCCCRCCCNQKYQKYDKHGSTCARSTMTMFLLLFTVIMAFATSMLLISFKDLDTSLHSAPRVVSSSFSNVDAVLNYTAAQATIIPKSAFQITSTAIMTDLQNSGSSISADLYAALNQPTFQTANATNMTNTQVVVDIQPENLTTSQNSFETTLHNVVNINETIENVLQHLRTLNPNMTGIQIQMRNLSSFLASAKEELERICLQQPTVCGTLGIDAQQLQIQEDIYDSDPNMATADATLESLKERIEQLGNEGLHQYYSIPDRIQNAIPSVQKELNSSLQTFEKEMDDNLITVQKEIADVRQSVGNISQDAERSVSIIVPYSDYVWYGAIGLATLYSVLLCLIFLGMCCGAASFKSKTLPTERRGCVVASGTIMMIFVYVTLLVSWIFMVAAMGIFLAGTISDSAICPVILGKADNYSKLDKALSVFVPNGSLPVNVSKALTECSYDNSTLFTILNLTGEYDLSSLYQELDNLDIHSEINQLTQNIFGIDVFSSNTEDAIRMLTEELSRVTFNNYNSSDIVKPVSALEVNIQNLLDKIGDSAVPGFEDLVMQLQTIMPWLSRLKGEIQSVAAEVAMFDALKDTSLSRVNQIYYAASKAKLHLNGTILAENGTLNEIVRNFADHQVKYGRELVDYIIYTIENDIGKCRPLYDTYENVAKFLCEDTIAPLNGIWLAWGSILIASVPTIIIATRLSKYYSRAKRTNVQRRRPEMYFVQAHGDKEHRV